MQIDRRRFLGATLAAGAALAAPRVLARPEHVPPPPPPAPAPTWDAGRPPLLDEALAALDRHAPQLVHHDRIGLVDFGAHSREPRFHLIDVAGGRIERTWLVAHGSGSDPAATGMLRRFSNQPGSNASSRGAFLTADTYFGKYGRSQRVVGLDPDNDLAFERAIVIHGAPYVDPSLIEQQGRIGRSQGCFAVELGEIDEVMARLGEGRMIYAGKLA
jgi:hypothetical protein